jgi:hypothetical protein
MKGPLLVWSSFVHVMMDCFVPSSQVPDDFFNRTGAELKAEWAAMVGGVVVV